jgi:hypothetical protein
MGQQRHLDRVRGLVNGYSGVPEAEITPETRLFGDLGIDGDTGDEFLEAFAAEFGVDMSGMALLNYFEGEPPFWSRSCLIPVAARLSSRFRAYVRHVARGRREITVRNLVVSARAGRWITPSVPRCDADLTRFEWWDLLYLAGGVVLPVGMGIWLWSYTTMLLAHAAAGTLFGVIILWALLAIKFFASFTWLRDLDAAATFEEQALSAAG